MFSPRERESVCKAAMEKDKWYGKGHLEGLVRLRKGYDD